MSELDREQFRTIVDKLRADLKAAGDDTRERAAIEKAVESLATIYSGDTPAELLRDGDGDIAGACEDADDDQYERWGDMLADACGY